VKYKIFLSAENTSMDCIKLGKFHSSL
jgi:hypothetical protein